MGHQTIWEGDMYGAQLVWIYILSTLSRQQRGLRAAKQGGTDARGKKESVGSANFHTEVCAMG